MENSGDINFFAKTNFRGGDKTFGIKVRDRRQHMYVIGKSGVGKTALLKNMALQDVHAGRGIAIVDPHGEFVEEVLDRIPSFRVNDVVYFNPADTDYPVGFNILQVPDTRYKHLVASDLMGVFTKIWANVWSARMEYILNNCVLALLDTPGTTLLGITRILVDKDYRQKIINNVKDPVVRAFWINEYESWRDQFRNEAIVPIQNKVGQFLSTSLIRNIVGQTKSTINVQEIMNNNKILLVNVSKGRVGEDNSALLGAMLITKIQLAAMERVRIPEEERKDFYLYVDEFQNFVTQSFAGILSEARKYRLNLIIAHQYVGQLEIAGNMAVRDAVFGNVGTLVSFRVGAADAEFLEKEFFPEFLAQDLVNLGNYNIYLRLMIDGVASRPFSAITLPPKFAFEEVDQRDKVIKVSRERYSAPREEVETKILRWSGMSVEETAVTAAVRTKTSTTGAADEEKKYRATCWGCGSETATAFMPDGARPIYCKECYVKTKRGEEVPLRFRPKDGGRGGIAREGDRYGALRGMGIEFEGDKEEVKPDSPKQGSVSLQDALKKEPVLFRRQRKEVNLEDLRSTLKDVLKKK